MNWFSEAARLRLFIIVHTKGFNPYPLRAFWGTASIHSPKRGDTSTSLLPISSFLKSLEYQHTTMKGQDSNPDSAVTFNPEQTTLSLYMVLTFLMYKIEELGPVILYFFLL